MHCCRDSFTLLIDKHFKKIHNKDAWHCTWTLPFDTHSSTRPPARPSSTRQSAGTESRNNAFPHNRSSEKAVHTPVASTTQLDAIPLLNASRSPPQSRHGAAVLPGRPHNSMRRAAAREPLGFSCPLVMIFLWWPPRQASPRWCTLSRDFLSVIMSKHDRQQTKVLTTDKKTRQQNTNSSEQRPTDATC